MREEFRELGLETTQLDLERGEPSASVHERSLAAHALQFLGRREAGIEAHRASIMKKLHLHSVSCLVRYAIRNKIVQP